MQNPGPKMSDTGSKKADYDQRDIQERLAEESAKEVPINIGVHHFRDKRDVRHSLSDQLHALRIGPTEMRWDWWL